MCNKYIKANEHFFVIRGQVLCRTCGKKLREKKDEHRKNKRADV